MYPGKQVYDKVDGKWVTVSNPIEAVKRDPERYSLREPAAEPVAPEHEPAPPSLEPFGDPNTEGSN